MHCQQISDRARKQHTVDQAAIMADSLRSFGSEMNGIIVTDQLRLGDNMIRIKRKSGLKDTPNFKLCHTL